MQKEYSFQLVESTIVEMQQALESGEITSRELVLDYLKRIAAYDKSGPKLNAVLEINPDAIYLAEALDLERKAHGVRGPLHGVPVLIKDNINTGDKMHTSAGSLALANSYAPEDAFLVKKLREAGAIILGKTNMTEFANFMADDMPSGYSSRGGQVINPYNPETTPGGSSSGSGVAVAANFCAVAVGTETSGSILNPAYHNAVVGIKPTVGLISRNGIVPIAHSQDTAGPMARTVADAATLLGAMTGVDEHDPATFKSRGKAYTDYRQYLIKDGLKGARIGVPREHYYKDLDPAKEALMTEAFKVMAELGADIVDSVKIPFARDFETWNVLVYEFKADLNAYLASLGANAPVRTLKEVIEFNNSHPAETLKYGQAVLLKSENTSGTLTDPEYIREKLHDLKASQTDGIDAVLKEYNLDALVFPGLAGADIAARAGYPSIIVPAGYTGKDPFGLSFCASAYSEPILIQLAYAYEQATKKRVKPDLRA